MKSTNDPILDLQALCKEKPRTAEELEKELRALGWMMPFESVLKAAKGPYIEESADGRFHPRGAVIRS